MSLLRAGAEECGAGAKQRGLDLSVRDIYIWAVVILFANQLLGVVGELPAASSASIEQLVFDLGAVGIFQYMAWYVIFRLLSSGNRAPEEGGSTAPAIQPQQSAEDRWLSSHWRHVAIEQ